MLYVFRDTVLHGKDADLSYQTNSDILDNVTQAMSKAFPGKPVYATFGNHDYYPTDQFPPHNNELYNDTLLRWSNWIMEPTEKSNFRKGNLCLGLASRLSNLSTVSNSKNGNDWLLADTCPSLDHRYCSKTRRNYSTYYHRSIPQSISAIFFTTYRICQKRIPRFGHYIICCS